MFSEKPYSSSISVSELNGLTFQGRKLNHQRTGGITLSSNVTPKLEDSSKFNQLSCAEVDYTEVDTGLHQLPVNFNCTASQYNRLLITNGRCKPKEVRAKANPLEVQSVESLNVPIFLRNQLDRAKVLQQQKLSELEQRSTQCRSQQQSLCGCCCCEQYCRECDEEIRLNQLIKGACCNAQTGCCNRNKSATRTKKPFPRIEQPTGPKEQEVVVNKSELRREELKARQQRKSSQEKLRKQQRDDQNYLKIMPRIMENLAFHGYVDNEKKKQQQLEDARTIQAKRQLRQFAQRVRYSNQYQGQFFEQKYAWGADQQRIITKPRQPLIEYERCDHSRKPDSTISKAFADVRRTSGNKPKGGVPMEEKCHPVAVYTPEQMQIARMIHFKDAMIEIGRFKREQLMKKQAVKAQLWRVQNQARAAIECAPKRKFKPRVEFAVAQPSSQENPEKGGTATNAAKR